MARLVLLGSPEPAVICLEALVEAGHDLALVVTEPDRRRGRGVASSPTPVKRRALELGIAVTDRVDEVLGTGAELGVVVAFGRLIRPPVLGSLLLVNVHFSLLPRWRGAAPVERAILAGDERTGVCLMQLDEGLDTGPVFARAETPILRETTAEGLRLQLAEAGAGLLVSRLTGGVAGLGTPTPQVGEPTYAAKITPADLHLDWSGPAAAIERQVRVGKAWTTFRGSRAIVWEAEATGEAGPPLAGAGAGSPPPGTVVDRYVATGDGWLRLGALQLEGRRRQAVEEWMRGARPAPGERFA